MPLSHAQLTRGQKVFIGIPKSTCYKSGLPTPGSEIPPIFFFWGGVPGKGGAWRGNGIQQRCDDTELILQSCDFLEANGSL